MSICCVVPSIRREMMTEFRKAWAPLFEKHKVMLITVWDGKSPEISRHLAGSILEISQSISNALIQLRATAYRDLFCTRTDAIRNLGFARAAYEKADYILTLDDDCLPSASSDPIQEHLDVLNSRVPISWMNTAMPWQERDCFPSQTERTVYLRGFPYNIREEAPVMVSHGVWVNVPDFDGKTQLELGKCDCDGGLIRNRAKDGLCLNTYACPKCNGTGYDGSKLPYTLPYFRGPIPRGVYAPICGMNLMVRKEALPYLYFAPMGPDTGVKGNCSHCGYPKVNNNHEDCCPDGSTHKWEGLNRFADIWMGSLLKQNCDDNNWAIYTGASTVIHTRASDPHKNVEQERLGVEWNEHIWKWMDTRPSGGKSIPDDIHKYYCSWIEKAYRFKQLIQELQK